MFLYETFILQIMHALGFRHEHQRPDRDKYIKVVMQNVISEMQYDFEIKYFDWAPYNKGEFRT